MHERATVAMVPFEETGIWLVGNVTAIWFSYSLCHGVRLQRRGLPLQSVPPHWPRMRPTRFTSVKAFALTMTWAPNVTSPDSILFQR